LRAVVQRVRGSSVSVDGEVVGEIGHGLLVLLAIHTDDGLRDLTWMVEKIAHLRIFQDAAGKMNKSVRDVNGGVLVVSQFTLYGNCLRGRRPDFLQSAPPDLAEPMVEQFITEMRRFVSQVESGRFGASMQVELVNDGPVTMVIDSPSPSKV